MLTAIAVWRDLARDLAVVVMGGRSEVRDRGLIDDLATAAAAIDPAGLVRFLTGSMRRQRRSRPMPARGSSSTCCSSRGPVHRRRDATAPRHDG